MEDGGYYVRIAGTVSGPFTRAEMRRAAERGLFSRFHQVSHDRVQWQPASALADVFSAEPASGEVVNLDMTSAVTPAAPPLPALPPESVGSAPTPAALPDARAVRLFTVVTACSAAALLLLSANLPHSRDDGGALSWWWQGGVLTMLACALATVAGLALPVVVWRAPRPGRSWTMALVGVAGCLLLIVLTIAHVRPWVVAVAGGLPALVAALLVAAVLLHSAFGQRARTAELCLVFTYVLVPASVAGIAAVVMQATASPSGDAGPTVAAGWALAAGLAWAVGQIAILAAAALCWVMLQRDVDDRRLNVTIVAAAGAGVVGLWLAAVIGAIGVGAAQGDADPAGRFVALQLLRLLVGASAFVLLAVTGWYEMLYDQLRNAPHPSVRDDAWTP